MTSQNAELRCRCGAVRGVLHDASPKTVTRMVCYCDDCQAFVHHLNRADLLDEHGGTEIVQVAPAALSFQQGREQIVGVRLSDKGMYRWYARCCNTPLGNTLTPSIPFVGIVAQGFESEPGARTRDALFGPPLGRIMGKFAIGTPPAGSTRPSIRLLVRAIRAVLGWRLTGQTWPHPFFDRASRSPLYPLTTLSSAERDRLRPLCGPR